MAITKITPLPTPPSTNDAANFNTRADEFLARLPEFANELNSFANSAVSEVAKAAQTKIDEITKSDEAIKNLESSISADLGAKIETNAQNIALLGGANPKIAAGKTLMTLIIDESESDPTACISLVDDAAGRTGDEMLTWLGLRPVLFQNGSVISELDANNYGNYKSGLAADITALGNDVMVEFPRRAWRIYKKNRKIYCQITDDLSAEGFVNYAWVDESGALKDNYYLGAYLAYASGGKLYSSSGKSPTTNQTIATFRTQAKARGAGYCQMGWFQRLYYQLTCLFVHQSLDFQTKVGKGRTSISGSGYQAVATGATNTKGHSWGDQTGTNQVKCNFLEDAWGNCWYFVDKIFIDASYTPLLTLSAANDTGAGYKCYGRGLLTPPASTAARYIREVVGTSELGFYPSFCNGAQNSHFCDGFWLAGNTIAYTSGAWYYGSRAGLFALVVDSAASDAHVAIGGRLCYL